MTRFCLRLIVQIVLVLYIILDYTNLSMCQILTRSFQFVREKYTSIHTKFRMYNISRKQDISGIGWQGPIIQILVCKRPIQEHPEVRGIAKGTFSNSSYSVHFRNSQQIISLTFLVCSKSVLDIIKTQITPQHSMRLRPKYNRVKQTRCKVQFLK